MSDFLFHLAEIEGIGVFFAVLPGPLLGLYDNRVEGLPIILLHERIRRNQRLLRCILAEELGHHFTSSGNLLAFACTQNCLYIKQEMQAAWWAVQHMVPLNKLIAKIVDSDFFTIHDLAQCFNVTEKFMKTALRLYFQEKGDSLLKEINRLSRGLVVLCEESDEGGEKCHVKAN